MPTNPTKTFVGVSTNCLVSTASSCAGWTIKRLYFLGHSLDSIALLQATSARTSWRTRGLVYRSSFGRNSANGALVESLPTRITPQVTGPFEITPQLSEREGQLRRALIATVFSDNKGGTPSNLAYVEEAFYFVPVQLALQLQQRG